MTLDEWKALQTQSKPKAEFNIRQAGEGEDGSRWTKGREYHKKHEEESDEEEESDDEEETVSREINFCLFVSSLDKGRSSWVV